MPSGGGLVIQLDGPSTTERDDGPDQIEREPARAHQSAVESRNVDELDE